MRTIDVALLVDLNDRVQDSRKIKTFRKLNSGPLRDKKNWLKQNFEKFSKRFVNLSGLQLSGVTTTWVEICLGGNFLSGNYPGWEFFEWKLSWWELYWAGMFWVGVFMLPSNGWFERWEARFNVSLKAIA